MLLDSDLFLRCPIWGEGEESIFFILKRSWFSFDCNTLQVSFDCNTLQDKWSKADVVTWYICELVLYYLCESSLIF